MSLIEDLVSSASHLNLNFEIIAVRLGQPLQILKKSGQVIELAGPNIKSFDEIFDVILNVKDRHAMTVFAMA